MTNIVTFLEEITSQGIRVSLKGVDALSVRGDGISKEIVEKSTCRKQEILNHLRDIAKRDAFDWLIDRDENQDGWTSSPEDLPKQACGCGSFMFWVDGSGRTRCQKCSPPTLSKKQHKKRNELRDKQSKSLERRNTFKPTLRRPPRNVVSDDVDFGTSTSADADETSIPL